MPPALNLLKRLKPRGNKQPQIKKKEKRLNIEFAKKRNPYRIFATAPIQDLNDMMDKWLFKLDPYKNSKEIKMFNTLKSRIPWQKAQQFFIKFAESEEPNILNYFHRYVLIEDIMMVKQFIQKRKPTSLGPYVYKQEIGKLKNIPSLPPKKMENKRPYITDFLSQCESDYKRAPWVKTTSPIIGVVLNIDFPEAKNWIIPEIINNKWGKVKTSWYKHTCKEGRLFIPGFVGYLTAKGDVIKETKEIYDAIKKSEEEDDDTVTEDSLDAAKILLRHAYPNINVDDMIVKLPKTSNHELAKTLSWMIVFTTRLIKGTQIYHTRLAQHRYVSGDIPFLTKYDMLPEVYENPDFKDREKVDEIIKSKRNIIESDFNIIREKGVVTRAKFHPQKPRIYNYPQVSLPPECKDIEDPIYFKEGGKMLCVPRKLIIDVDINPYTGTPFHKDIKARAMRLKDLKPPISPQEKEEKELAPGLFNSLKEEIEAILAFEPVYCAKCHNEITDKSFKSVQDGKSIEFCSIDCFDKYKFKDK